MRSLIMQILLIPLLLVATCGALEPRKADYPVAVDGTVLWVAAGIDGPKKIVVWRTPDGKLMVFAGPEYTYQDATDRGISENRALDVVTRWIEVTRNPLDSPKSAFGWRNPWNRTLYPDRVFREQQGNDGMLEVYSNGNGGYMVVVTLLEDSSLRVYPPRVNQEAMGQ